MRLYPIALSRAQIDHWKLPLIAAENPTAAQRAWEQRHEGQVELDALEALYPGELANLVRRAFASLLDLDLPDRVQEAQEEVQEELDERQQEVLDRHAEEMREIEQRHRAVLRDYQALCATMVEELREEEPELPERPEAEEPDGLDEAPLYDSDRDYMDQIAFYRDGKEGQG